LVGAALKSPYVFNNLRMGKAGLRVPIQFMEG